MNGAEASRLLEKVPELCQKITGKFIPVEVRTVTHILTNLVTEVDWGLHQKFVASKARKFQSQGRLALPVLEFSASFWESHTGRAIVSTGMLSEVEKVLEKSNEHEKDPRDIIWEIQHQLTSGNFL
jgi:hypothetical protein